MKTIIKKCVTLLLVIFFCTKIFANGITISNLTVLPATNQVQFDITWENSWRSDVLNNWDAAWVFLKYKDLSGKYYNIYLTNLNNVFPSGFTTNFIPYEASTTLFNGALIYRSAASSGTSLLTNVKLGIPSLYASGVWDIKAFGIEMVYIPTGPFFLGDGVSTNSYRAGFTESYPTSIGEDINPNFGGGFFGFDPIFLGGNALLYGQNRPFGFKNFYCMKYEISQGGYRDFLNTLGYNQQINHTATNPSSAIGTNALTTVVANRPFIEIAASGNAVTKLPAVYGCDGNSNNVYDEAGDGEWLACNNLNWPDLAAYLVWAGLVPMTETQYEKACRGPLQPVAGEYAWGTTQVASNLYTLSNAAFTNELVSNASTTVGNANYQGTNQSSGNGPLRNGIFATATSNRVTSGGSYYGVMELSGNLWERVVTTANQKGLDYTGKLYYATLDDNGFVAPSDYNGTSNFWPGTFYNVNVSPYPSINGTVPALGLMLRGGSYSSPISEITISSRVQSSVVTTSTETTRSSQIGGRGIINLQ
jgi:formylglycine-generating enzyme required for sulfatase activity